MQNESFERIADTLLALQPFTDTAFADTATQRGWGLDLRPPALLEAHAGYDVVFSAGGVAPIAWVVLSSTEQLPNYLTQRAAVAREYECAKRNLHSMLGVPAHEGSWSPLAWAYCVWTNGRNRVSLEQSDFDGIAPMVILCAEGVGEGCVPVGLSARLYPSAPWLN